MIFMTGTTNQSLKTAVRTLTQETQPEQPKKASEISLNRKTYEKMAQALADSGKSLPEGMIAFLASGSLLHFFEGVPDYRDPDKVTYELSAILALAFLAIATEGECGFKSIADEIRYRLDSFYEDLGLIQNGQYPSHDVFRNVFCNLDPVAFRDHLIWSLLKLAQSHPLPKGQHLLLEIDGKEILGTGRAKTTKNPQRNVNVLNVYNATDRMNMVAIPIDSKTNEIPTAREALYHLDLKGVYITADALHKCEETCQLISMKEGKYVFPVKDKRTRACQQVTAVFEDPRLIRGRKKTVIGSREFEYYKLGQTRQIDGYPSARLVVKMISHTHRPEPVIRYFISNSQKPEAVLEAICRRWEIENDLHKVKDSKEINEDGIRFRNETALRNMTTLTDFITLLIQLFQALNLGMPLKQAKKHLKWKPVETIQAVLSALGKEEFIEKLRTVRTPRVNRRLKLE